MHSWPWHGRCLNRLYWLLRLILARRIRRKHSDFYPTCRVMLDADMLHLCTGYFVVASREAARHAAFDARRGSVPWCEPNNFGVSSCRRRRWSPFRRHRVVLWRLQAISDGAAELAAGRASGVSPDRQRLAPVCARLRQKLTDSRPRFRQRAARGGVSMHLL